MDGTSVAGISTYVKPLAVAQRALVFNDVIKVSKKKYKKIKACEDLKEIEQLISEECQFDVFPVIITDGVNNLLIDEEE